MIRFEECLDEVNQKLFEEYRTKIQCDESGYFGVVPVKMESLTNQTKRINTITLSFNQILDTVFLSFFCEVYGKTENVFKVAELKFESKSNIIERFHQDLTKRKYETKKVTINDYPDFLIWNKPRFKIHAKFDYKLKCSQILFLKN